MRRRRAAPGRAPGAADGSIPEDDDAEPKLQARAPQAAWQQLIVEARAFGWTVGITSGGRTRLTKGGSVLFCAGPGAPDETYTEGLQQLRAVERLAEKRRRP